MLDTASPRALESEPQAAPDCLEVPLLAVPGLYLEACGLELLDKLLEVLLMVFEMVVAAEEVVGEFEGFALGVALAGDEDVLELAGGGDGHQGNVLEGLLLTGLHYYYIDPT